MGAGGSDSTAKSVYLSNAPSRPLGCTPLIHAEILLLPPVAPTLGRMKHFSSVEKCVLPRSCTRWSPRSSRTSACRLTPATSATNLSFDGLDCGDSMVGVSKV